MHSQFVILFSVFFAVAATGCGSSNRPTYPVTGKVTFNGEPLTTGTIMLTPKGGGPSAQGQIAEDGTYSVWTFEKGDGAVPGKHAVTIVAAKDNGPNSLMTRLIPDKYGALNSGLEVEVKETDNTTNFELTGTMPKAKKPIVMP